MQSLELYNWIVMIENLPIDNESKNFFDGNEILLDPE